MDSSSDSATYITIDDMRVFGRHGYYEEERRVEQEFSVSIVVILLDNRALTTDILAHTVDYDAIKKIVLSVFQDRQRYLLESIAACICTELLESFPLFQVDVHIKKLTVWKDGVPGVRIVKKRLIT